MRSMTLSWAINMHKMHKLASLLIVLLILWVLASPVSVSAFAGFGDYISEKLLGNGVNEAQYLGDGTAELTVLGSGPIITTGTIISQSAGSAVVNGNLSSLNGMPSADVWFEYGITSGALINSTTPVTVTTTGTQTAILTGLTGGTVYYQIVASTDGTTRGDTAYFASGEGFGNWLMNTLLPIVLAAVILIGVLLLTGNPIAALLATVVGLAAYYIILALVSSL